MDKTPIYNDPKDTFVGLAAYHVLMAHQDSRAEAILEQIYDMVQAQAAKIKDDAQCQVFLGNIPEHREIMALWET